MATSNTAPTGFGFPPSGMKVIRRSNADPLLALHSHFQLTMKGHGALYRAPPELVSTVVSRTRLQTSGLARLDWIG